MKNSTKKIALAAFLGVQPWIVSLLMGGEFSFPSFDLAMTYVASMMFGFFGATWPFRD